MSDTFIPFSNLIKRRDYDWPHEKKRISCLMVYLLFETEQKKFWSIYGRKSRAIWVDNLPSH